VEHDRLWAGGSALWENEQDTSALRWEKYDETYHGGNRYEGATVISQAVGLNTMQGYENEARGVMNWVRASKMGEVQSEICTANVMKK
jgi:hypothetical protein